MSIERITHKTLMLTAVLMLAVDHSFAVSVDKEQAFAIAKRYAVQDKALVLVGASSARKSKSSIVSVNDDIRPYYVFSRGENQGIVIIAGDDRLPAVIGYTEHGDWDEGNIPPLLSSYLDYCQGVVEDSIDTNNIEQANINKNRRRAASDRNDVSPFITSHWNQRSPYNDCCPHTSSGKATPAGCVAIAAGQILYYWRDKLPNALLSTTPTYQLKNGISVTNSYAKGTPINWSLIKDEYTDEDTEDSRKAVADLVFALGAANMLSYSTKNTSGKIERLPYTLSTFFGMCGGKVLERSKYSQEDWTNVIYEELKEGRPVLYGGTDDEKSGHATVIHGYRSSDDLFYFNFGWAGEYDGYYTTNLTNGMNGYHNSQMALVGLYPSPLEVILFVKDTLFVNETVEYTLRVKNNSDCNFSGVYLFSGTTDNYPSYLNNAFCNDTKTTVKPGSTVDFNFTKEITNKGTNYIVATDGELNTLARAVTNVYASLSDLSLRSLQLTAENGVLDLNGERYHFIDDNSSTSMSTNLTNRGTAAYSGSVYGALYSSSDGSDNWEKESSVIISSVKLNVGETNNYTFDIYGLKRDKYYKVEFPSQYLSTSVSYNLDGSDSHVIYFTIGDATAISGLHKENNEKQINEINGQTCHKLRGNNVYIINGKKVLVK